MENAKKVRAPEREGTFASSVIMFIICVSVIMVGILVLGLDAHIPLIFACAIIMIYAAFLHIPLGELETAMANSAATSMGVMVVIIVVGTLIASFMAAGTVPYIIYVGLELINPAWFLAFVTIMCAILSSVTGSSWTTCGTIGVAFIGISIGLGIPVGMAAGAVAGGAYFGDKQSPISDFAMYAAGVSRVNIYKHCKNMLYTTGPALIVSIIIYFVLGMRFRGGEVDAAQIEVIRGGLEQIYNFSPIVLLPLVVLIAAIILKLPTTVSLFLGMFCALIIAITYQGMNPGDVLKMLMNGYSIDPAIAESVPAEVAKICQRGGVSSMLYTLALMICSLAMAGGFDRTKMLTKIVDKMENIIKNRVGLIATTLVTGIGMSYFACDPYIAAIIPVKAYEKKYEEMGLDRCVLSRTISDGGVNFCPIVPWGSSGVFTSQTLGVPVGQYIGYYYIGWGTCIMALVCAITGWGMKTYDYSQDQKDSVMTA
ncbi:Na+/H+ antiporter NhaC family protein [Bacilliculturomica massiliensis]|uniref:Na+/H+ antiporter NhaC family protein n=1 Tax=Bacilliculturomica massiliensis TaxID=1917867 RepID=UPI001031365D|nr:Na+/H+ antiporter NhaC family protein [Bacilliculturomica massiliensis]